MDINLINSILLSENFINWMITAIVLSMVAGHVIHKLLGSASFGAVANAFILLGAIFVAKSVDGRAVAMLLPEDGIRISLMACVFATGMLMMFAGLKHWLRDQF